MGSYIRYALASMLQPTEIDWKTGEVQMTRCPEECGKK